MRPERTVKGSRTKSERDTMTSKLVSVFTAIDNAIRNFTTLDWDSAELEAWHDAMDSEDAEEIERAQDALDAFTARVEWLATQAADCGRSAKRALLAGDACGAETKLEEAYHHEDECGDATHWRPALTAMEEFDVIDEIEALQYGADGDLDLVELCNAAIAGDADAKLRCVSILAEVASRFAEEEAADLADAMDGRR